MSPTIDPKLASNLWRVLPHTFAHKASGARWLPYSHLKYLGKKIAETVAKPNGRLIVCMPPRHGKALEVNTPILTTRGWRKVSELNVRDKIFHPSGKSINVIAKSKTWKNRDIFKVTSDDGAEIFADSDHLWTVRLCRKRPVWKNHTTEWLHKRESIRRPMLPKNKAIEFEKKSLKIPPYTLGMWIGDGTTLQAIITCHDDDAPHIRGYIEQDGFKTSDQKTKYTFGVLKLKKLLRDMKLLGNTKRIPREYLFASKDQRLKLLQGLIDSDGYVARDGQVEFCSKRKNLAEDVQFLVRSLGAKASLITGRAVLNGVDHGEKYRVMFYLKNAARLPRKNKRTRDCVKTPSRFISIKKEGKADTICIQVDSPDGLFLAGSGLMVTHNSELISYWTPAWFLDMCPDKRVIISSYSADLAMDFGRKVRNEIKTNPWIVSRLSEDSQGKDRFHMADGGGLVATGIDGALTGKGGDLIIADDMVKNWEQARSPTYHQKCVNWFDTTLYTRLEPDASIIVVMTRWHESDLVGYLTGEHGDEWDTIILPAIAEENDPIGRNIGEALCSERYDLPSLNRIKVAVTKHDGSRAWDGLYRQSPSALEGNIFKRSSFKTYSVMPEMDEFSSVITSWDFTFKDSKKSDYVCGLAMAKKGPDKYILPFRIHRKMGFTDSLKAMRSLKERYPAALTHLVEAKANGEAIMNVVDSKISGLVPTNPTESKEARAEAVAPQVDSGHVYIPDMNLAPWIWEACDGDASSFIHEVTTFPNSKNDDYVDAFTQGLKYLGESELNSLEDFLTL